MTESAVCLPAAIDGFESVMRGWEANLDLVCARIMPGEFYVTSNDEAISTVLGSCVSACIRVPRLRLGGMNHFMLPAGGASAGPAGQEARYGTFAMERLINEFLKRGASRAEMEVKVVGGGKMYASKTNIGQLNIRFVFEYLENEGMTVIGQDVGGVSPRRVQYFPSSGRLRVKKLPMVQSSAVEHHEREHLQSIRTCLPTGSVELFGD